MVLKPKTETRNLSILKTIMLETFRVWFPLSNLFKIIKPSMGIKSEDSLYRTS
jgi:hypothetical protein